MTTQKVWRTTDNLERRSATGFLAAKIRSNRVSNGIFESQHWVVTATLTETINYFGMVCFAIPFLPSARTFSIVGAVLVMLLF